MSGEACSPSARGLNNNRAKSVNHLHPGYPGEQLFSRKSPLPGNRLVEEKPVHQYS